MPCVLLVISRADEVLPGSHLLLGQVLQRWDFTSLVENKKCALIVTAGGDEFDGADLVVEAYHRMVDFHRMKDLGRLVVANFHDLEILEAPHIRTRIGSFCEKVK